MPAPTRRLGPRWLIIIALGVALAVLLVLILVQAVTGGSTSTPHSAGILRPAAVGRAEPDR